MKLDERVEAEIRQVQRGLESQENWWQIWEFALTFDGYDQCGSFDRCADVGNRWAAAFARDKALPESLTKLHTCLFFEQRRWHHFGDNPDEASARYIRDLLEEIRRRVLADEVE